jgi:capsular exopolysaccharide synthesis family protein
MSTVENERKMKELEGPASELAEYTRPVPQSLAPPPILADFEAAQPSVAPSHYLLVVWRQKWKILLFVAAAMLVTFLISSRITPVYEATAKIDVDRQVPTGVVGQEATQATANEDSDSFMATEMEIIQSDAVLRPVAERYGLLEKEDQIDGNSPETIRRKTDAPVVLKRLKVSRPISTYLLDVSYRSPDPKLAADVANAIAQSFLEHTFDIRIKSSGALSAFMQTQLEELKARMERSSMALNKFEQQLNVINPEDKTNMLSARLLQLNTDYTNAQSARMTKEAEYKSSKGGTVAEAMITDQGQDLSKLQERVNTAKQHLADVAAVYGPNHAEYRKAKSELEEVQRQFEELHANVSQRVEADYKEAVQREEMLKRAVQSTKAEYDQLNSRSFEYQQLKREAETDKGLYSDLERRIREATINSGFRNNGIRIADMARPPDEPVFPNKKLNLLLAFLGSAILGICIAIIADVMDHTIRDPEQAARSLDTSVLGVLPTVKEMRRLTSGSSDNTSFIEGMDEFGNPSSSYQSMKLIRYNADEANRKSKKRGLMRINSPGSEAISSYEEAIRTLRHSILLPDLDRTMKSILITSPAPGEGKSTAIIHLAVAHAEQGKRTLIIDADLRRPSIHKKLGISGTLGLSNVLLGEFQWREMLLKVEQWPNLEVLPAGMVSRRASDLVGSMMLDILHEAAAEYDLILVDAPPLLGFAESMQVAKSVDGVVVMARAGQTSKRAVATALATLKRLRANVVGLVLNEVTKGNANGSYYYNDYRKYYAPAADRRI